MPDLEQIRELIPDDPLTPAWQPLGRYTDEYNRIYEQILTLEFQINMLEKNVYSLKLRHLINKSINWVSNYVCEKQKSNL